MRDSSFIFFADWTGRPVLDSSGQRGGFLWDFVINPQESYPRVTHLIITTSRLPRRYAVIPMDNVEIKEGFFRFTFPIGDLITCDELDSHVYRLKKDVLDQQVVDTFNHKVVRVNDVHLLCVNSSLRVVHVDIGSRGLVRRLGWESIIDTAIGLVRPKAVYLQNDLLVSWKFVKTISLDPSQPIQINLTAKQLDKIPPADLGDLLLDLDIHQRVALFRTAAPHQRARLFERLEFPDQEQLLESLDTRESVELLSNMSADEAVDLLGEMPADQSRQLLSLMESTRAKKLSQLLGYEEDEAGGIMTTEYLEMPRGLTVQDAIALIKEKTPEMETIYYLYVIDDTKKLMGTTTLRRLIAADPATPVEQTTFPKPVYVYINAPLKEVAFLMDKYKVSALPVVNKERQLQGIITVDDVLHHVIPIAWRRQIGKKRPQ